eukprot:CAMPEP_0167758232 /NCGR_PEP_ID=MMETSP0110_2-20121227/10356_1 /TAXON_ID=629695 /ORGANISM="Gymnochlora sp., Strain CCMP2014" /LENGTH=444 /DNA_ID=CAMNT_0007644489 /DNA_START=23 /DNA_END=1357 /DNA_ORIENTATION=-
MAALYGAPPAMGAPSAFARGRAAKGSYFKPLGKSTMSLFKRIEKRSFEARKTNFLRDRVHTRCQAETREFPELKNDLMIRAARGEQTERVPVWMHRQAGRYLPEFRNFSDRFPFMYRCSTPEIATRLTIQPVERYGLDAAIIFSDILVLLPLLGVEWGMVKGKGPVVSDPIDTPEDMVRVRTVSPSDVRNELGYVMEALTRSRLELDGRATLIGFSGAPWTLLGYMVQGEGAKSTQAVKAKGFLYQYPEASHEFLKTITDAVVHYLVEQVRSGAQMVQVFDSWAGELPPKMYAEFSTPYLKEVATRVKAELKAQGLPEVPVSVFPKGASTHVLPDLSDSDYDVISLDEGIAPEVARLQAPNKVLQGNLDPAVLYLPPKQIIEQTRKMIDAFGTEKYIANLGYAVDKSMDPELVGAFVEEVHSYSDSLIGASNAAPAAAMEALGV